MIIVGMGWALPWLGVDIPPCRETNGGVGTFLGRCAGDKSVDCVDGLLAKNEVIRACLCSSFRRDARARRTRSSHLRRCDGRCRSNWRIDPLQ